MGKAQSPSHYNHVYQETESYARPFWDSVYYPAWMLVLSHLRHLSVTRVLDLGCGPGQFGQFLNAYEPGIIYFGIDFSSEAIRRAKAGLPNAVLRELDLSAGLAFPPLEGQAVIALEMLEHIENDLGLIESLPSGCSVIFSVPDFDWESHVRFFPQIADVRKRYEPLLDFKALDAVRLAGGATLFVARAVRRDLASDV